jgi:hypothetical protein
MQSGIGVTGRLHCIVCSDSKAVVSLGVESIGEMGVLMAGVVWLVVDPSCGWV